MHRSSQELEGMLTVAQLLQPPKPWTDLQEVQERLSAPALAALALVEVREDQDRSLGLGLEPPRSRRHYYRKEASVSKTLLPGKPIMSYPASAA